MRALLTSLLLGASLCAAGCGDGSGGSGGSGGDTTTSTGAGGATATGGTTASGGTTSAGGTTTTGPVIDDYGYCSDTGTELVGETLYAMYDAGTLGWIDNGLSWNCAATCLVHNEIITDQAAYQKFEDQGLAPVDFTTHIVLVAAGKNPQACGGSTSEYMYTLKTVDGAPNLEFDWREGGYLMNGECSTCNLFSWAMVAVKIPIPDKQPTFCNHIYQGC